MAGFKGGGGRDCGAIQEEGARFREATAERLKKGLNGATWPNQGLALLALARGVRGGAISPRVKRQRRKKSYRAG